MVKLWTLAFRFESILGQERMALTLVHSYCKFNLQVLVMGPKCVSLFRPRGDST
jgi:hypothetical protein